MINRLPLAAAAAMCLGIPGTPTAHHGAAAYDRESLLSLEGTITSYRWENPHALISLQADRGAGRTEEWVVETAGLVILARVGWNRSTLEPGDACTVTGFPAKNGSHTMILRKILLEDGSELTSYIP